jgi:uncharacterized membrane protein
MRDYGVEWDRVLWTHSLAHSLTGRMSSLSLSLSFLYFFVFAGGNDARLRRRVGPRAVDHARRREQAPLRAPLPDGGRHVRGVQAGHQQGW